MDIHEVVRSKWAAKQQPKPPLSGDSSSTKDNKKSKNGTLRDSRYAIASGHTPRATDDTQETRPEPEDKSKMAKALDIQRHSETIERWKEEVMTKMSAPWTASGGPGEHEARINELAALNEEEAEKLEISSLPGQAYGCPFHGPVVAGPLPSLGMVLKWRRAQEPRGRIRLYGASTRKDIHIYVKDYGGSKILGRDDCTCPLKGADQFKIKEGGVRSLAYFAD